MQFSNKELKPVNTELKIVSAITAQAAVPKETLIGIHGAVNKGRLARQRGFEVKALFERLKATQRRVEMLEATLREIQPHFFDDHPISEKINTALLG
ncbi:hypothetical protein PS718_01587 [Pseudomonas fluorescens]|uniref:Uncharacterized protein n=1 Tax=Pseudomonas fluorescens TaxID=294 RepID=A0A5E7BQT8_PSEFL|nr:hypothetical protein [Pseudomonas fluorescens]VVN87181.1 hypothetical protein PS718_01587 [Pseudomonas fluorescens]